MTDPTIAGDSQRPDGPLLLRHTVTIAFDVRAPSPTEATHIVRDALNQHTEDLRTDVAGIRSWEQVASSPRSQPREVVREVLPQGWEGWEDFDGSPIPDLLIQMFPKAPRPEEFRHLDGSLDELAFDDADDAWRDECLGLAVAASQLPTILARTADDEQVPARTGHPDPAQRSAATRPAQTPEMTEATPVIGVLLSIRARELDVESDQGVPHPGKPMGREL